jgi:hypothetical protein
MDQVLSGLKWNICLVYLDDVVVCGKTFKEHQEIGWKVFLALQKTQLTLNVKKCAFAQRQILC